MNKIILLIVVFLIFGVTIYNINNYDNRLSTLDYLIDSLSPVKEQLSGNAVLSMISNEDDKIVIYLQTQFALSPNIVQQSNFENDTIVIIGRISNPELQDFEEYNNLILKDSNSLFRIALYSK